MTSVTAYPTSNAAHSTGFTNPTNAYSDNGTYATGAPAANRTISTDYGTFGFDTSIPDRAVIDTVTLEYQYKVSSTLSVLTGRVSTILGGTHGTDHDDTTEPLADTTNSYDVTAERSWTRADLLDANFGVHLAGVRGAGIPAGTFSFDFVRVVVTFHVPSTQAWIQ